MVNIIIVGAGIAGLSLAIALAQHGHSVRILEAAPELAEIGAGVQMTPQAIRYYFEWGLKEDIMRECIIPKEMQIRDGKDGRLLTAVPTGSMEDLYGAPYLVIHRANLHAILHKHAVKAGATLQLGSRVVKYDFANGSVELHTGQTLQADLVVAADGINSFARSQLLGDQDPGSRPTGWAAVRMMTEISTLEQDPITAPLVNKETRSSCLWLAAGRSAMTYQVKDGTMLNIVLSHRDDVDMSNFTLEQYQETVREWFADFEEPVRRMISLALPKIANYPVYQVPPLPRWAHESGRFTLLGDAAHAMAFYLSMGVSLAVEDAICLSAALEKVSTLPTTEELKSALHLFEKTRMTRAQVVQEASVHAGNMAHKEGDLERKKLYHLMAGHGMDEAIPFTPTSITQREGYGLADKAVRDWCYDFDAAKVR